MLGDEDAAPVVDRDRVGAEAHGELAPGKGRVGGVQVAPAHLHLPVPVGPPAHPRDAGEGRPRQRGELHAVLDEQLALRLVPEVVVLLRERHAQVGEAPVVCGHRGHLGNGDEQVGAQIAHLGFDVALLVARHRVAESEAEAVVGGAGGEQLGGTHLVADAPAHAGGVVEHDEGGNAADVLLALP